MEPQSFWTDARVAQLRDLADGTRSARIIAQTMGTSRNSIVGKVRRLGLELARPGVQRKLTARGWYMYGRPTGVPRIKHNGGGSVFGSKGWQPRSRPAKILVKPADGPVPDSRLVPLLDLRESHCRWPVGEAGPDLRFCAADKTDYSS